MYSTSMRSLQQTRHADVDKVNVTEVLTLLCVFTCVFVWIYIYVGVCMDMYVHVCMYILSLSYKCMKVLANLTDAEGATTNNIYISYIHSCICICIYIYIYIYINTYIGAGEPDRR